MSDKIEPTKNMDDFISDNKYNYCQDLKKHLYKIKNTVVHITEYSKGPGASDLKRLNELIIFYHLEEKGLDIYDDLLMVYPNDVVIKTGKADLLVKMDGRVDDALQFYYQTILTTGERKDTNFYNLYKRIALYEILNNKDYYTINKLPHIKKKHYKVDKFNEYSKDLKNLTELIYTKGDKQEKELLELFFKTIIDNDFIDVIPLFYYSENTSILNYKEMLNYFEILGGYNFKKTIFRDIGRLKYNQKYKFEDVHLFCTKVDDKFAMLIKELYDSESMKIKEYNDLINIINSKNEDKSYDFILDLIKSINDKAIIYILHKVIINVLGFDYIKKFTHSINGFDKDIFDKRELVSDLISLSIEHYSDSREYYEVYGSLHLNMEEFELAGEYYKKINDIGHSNSAKLMELYCSLCIMSEKEYLNYKMEDLSYIISAMKHISRNKHNRKYLYKLNKLCTIKKDPLMEISNAFIKTIEGKPLSEEELRKLKELLGDNRSAFFQAIEEVSKRVNPNNEIEVDNEELDSGFLKSINENNYDIENICDYLFSKENPMDLKELLRYLPLLKGNLSRENKKNNFTLLKKEVQDAKRLENQDIYFLESFKSKSLQLMNYGLGKDDSDTFYEYGHKYYEILNIINKKDELTNILQNSFESIIFYEFRSKIINDPQEHFKDPFVFILTYFEKEIDFDKLKENLIYFYYLHEFFNNKGVEDRSNIKIQDINILEKLMNLSKDINEYIDSDDIDVKRTLINSLIKVAETLKDEINNEFIGQNIGTKKFRENYKSIIINFVRLFNNEKTKLRKKVNLDIKLLNDFENITKNNLLHLYLTNSGDKDANNINVSVDLLKDGQIKESKHISLNDLRRQNSIGFNMKFVNLNEGKYIVSFVIDYVEGIDNEQFSKKIEIGLSENQYSYTRIRNNIYKTHPAGYTDAYFYGRQGEIEEIEDNLFYDGSHSIFIRGLRRVGKSSLLNKVASSFNDKCFPIICDSQAIRANSSEELIYNAFIRKIIDQFNSLNQRIDDKIIIDNMSFEEFVELPGNEIDKFDNFLRDIESKIGNKILLILIDEFEGLLNAKDAGVKELLNYFRSILGDKSRKVYFIFAGGEDIISRNEVSTTRIADSSLNIRLGFLNENAAIELIEGPSEDLIKYTQESIEDIIYYTKGHPFYIVQICINLIRKLNEEKTKNVIYPDDVQYSVEEVVKEGLFDNIEEIIVDSCERAIIIFLGTFLTHKDEGLNINSIIKIFKEFNSTFGIKDRYYSDDIKGSAERLVDKNVLEKTTDGRANYYRFTVELWRIWYKNNCVSKWSAWLKSNDINDSFNLEDFGSEIYIKEWSDLHD